jgi:hypothetical protein
VAAVIGLALAMLAAGPARQEESVLTAESVAAAAAIKTRNLELRSKPEERGCLGADAVTCLASMGFYVYISSTPPDLGGLGALKLPTPVERDIHGQPISQMVSFLVTFAPGVRSIMPPDAIDADLFLVDGAHISRVTFFLPAPPLFAKTESQWAATRVFELATAALGEKCVGTDRLAFYRRYDDAQKSDGASTGIDSVVADPSVSSSVRGHLDLCGARMVMTATGGVSMDAGSYDGSLLSIEPLPAK